MNIETMVHVEIEERLTQMSQLDPAGEEYRAVADATLKLIDRATKMEELNIQSKENETKLAQMIEDRNARKTDQWLRVASIAIPSVTALVGGLIFSVIERTEVHANTPTREFIKRALRLS